MTDGEKKYPKVCTGAYIFNAAGKLFLMRGEKKFANQYFVPGGHVDWGEKLEDCVRREIKEETGFAIHSVEFFRVVEFIFDPVYSTEKHFVGVDYLARTDASEDDVALDNREATEFIWLTPEEIVKRSDIEKITKESVEFYLEKQKNSKSPDEYKNLWQRALADYQNLKKETEARRGEWAQMSEQVILEEFIPVYDNFKKAFGVKEQLTINNEQANWVKGIEHIKRQFWDILKAHNVEEIKTVGKMFDPKLHEAAGEESADGQSSGTILREVDGGYTMGGRVIKVAKVVIAK